MTTTADSPAGAAIVVYAATSGTVQANSVADDAGNTYTAGTNYLAGASRQRPFWCFNCRALSAGSSITVTFGQTSNTKLVAAASVIGLLALDSQGAGATGTSTAPTITTGTFATAHTVVFGMVTANSGASDTFAEAAGWTSLTPALNSTAARWAYQIEGVATAVTYAPTLGTSRTWGINYVAFKAGACGALLLLKVGC